MTNIDPSGSKVGLAGGVPVIVRTAMAVCGSLVLVFLAGTASGYVSVMLEEGKAAPRDAAILGAVALAMAGVGYGIWRFALRALFAVPAAAGPGEQRTLERQRRQMVYFALAGVIGGVTGFSAGVFDQGDASLLSGDWESLRLPPLLALGLVVLLIGGLVVLPLWGFRMIDDYKREQNLIAFAGGCISVLASYPVWAVLHAGGFTPPPHAFGIFGIAYVSMIVSLLYARWRL